MKAKLSKSTLVDKLLKAIKLRPTDSSLPT